MGGRQDVLVVDDGTTAPEGQAVGTAEEDGHHPRPSADGRYLTTDDPAHRRHVTALPFDEVESVRSIRLICDLNHSSSRFGLRRWRFRRRGRRGRRSRRRRRRTGRIDGIRTANSGHEKRLEADGLSQIAQTEGQRAAVDQVFALAQLSVVSGARSSRFDDHVDAGDVFGVQILRRFIYKMENVKTNS